MLKIEHVYKTFNAGTVNEKRALQDLNLVLNPGDFVTVIGGNGAGKSTMLNCVSGAYDVEEGRIIIDGVDVIALPEYKRAKFIGRVFQDPMMGTAATMQIEENLALAARRGKNRNLRIGTTKAEREEYMEQLKILDLGLENRMTAKVGLLSGGLLAQYQGSATIDMGRGAIVIGLAAVIIGEVLLSKVFLNFALKLLSCVIGAIIYYIVITFVLRLGLESTDLKLLTAVVVGAFLAIPYLKGQMFAKPVKRGGTTNA